jgi:hypothetical protein
VQRRDASTDTRDAQEQVDYGAEGCFRFRFRFFGAAKDQGSGAERVRDGMGCVFHLLLLQDDKMTRFHHGTKDQGLKGRTGYACMTYLTYLTLTQAKPKKEVHVHAGR